MDDGAELEPDDVDRRSTHAAKKSIAARAIVKWMGLVLIPLKRSLSILVFPWLTRRSRVYAD